MHVKQEMKLFVNYLIEHGADVNPVDYLKTYSFYPGLTSLTVAIENGNEFFMKYLIENGAVVNTPYDDEYNFIDNEDSNYYIIPLIFAIKKGNESIVKYLIEHEAEINDKNENIYDTHPKKVPLIMACIEKK